MRRQVIAIQQGISTEKGKEIVAIIKQTKTEGPVPDPGRAGPGDREEHRRSPGVIQLLKGKDLGVEMQFVNRRP